MTRVYAREEVRPIAIRARRPLGNLSAGEAKTRARGGQGLEFADFREYEAGDEVSRIDWSVTARLGKPWVRTYLEERGFPVLLLVDVSSSTLCALNGLDTGSVIRDVAARLGSAAIWSGCETALVLFADRVVRYVPAATGVAQLTRMVRELREISSQDAGVTDVAAALEYAQKVRQRRSLVFLLSDFLCGDFAQALRRFAGQHEVVAIGVDSLGGAEIADCGLVNVRDPETARPLQIDTSNFEVRNVLATAFAARRERNAEAFRETGTDYLEIGVDYVTAISDFLRQRVA